MDVLRRVPGARSQAYVAKWLMLFSTMLGAVLWLALSWLLGWSVLAEDIQLHALEFMLGEFPSGPFWQLFWLGAVVCSWAFVVAHWLARSGAAAIASMLVLGLLLAPVAWIFWMHPYFLPFGPTHVPMIALVLLATAMAVSALSWFVGLRFHGAFWKPGLLGLAAVVALSGVAYAYTSHELDKWTEIEPHHEAFRIRQAYVSPSGQRLYLNVNRGEPWYAGRPRSGHNLSRAEWFRKRGTPVQAWIVDLETGRVTRDATDGQHTFTTASAGGYSWSMAQNVIAPSGVVGRAHFDKKEVRDIRWLDADTGDIIATLSPDLTSGPLEAAHRAYLREFVSRLDSKGRRVWLRNGEVEREGQLLELPSRPLKRSYALHATEVPGGWRTFARDEQGGGYRTAFLDLESGQMRVLDKHTSQPTLYLLSPTRAVRMKRVKNRFVVSTLVDANTGVVLQDVRNPPARLLGGVGGDRMLCVRDIGSKQHAVHLWDPASGESRAVSYDHAVPTDYLTASMRGRLPDGRVMLEILQRPQSTDPADYWHAFAALDARTGEAEVLGEVHHRDHYAQPLVVEEDGSLLVLEAQRRIVRHRGPGNREVVWPKAE
jgi:hypothetical protein